MPLNVLRINWNNKTLKMLTKFTWRIAESKKKNSRAQYHRIEFDCCVTLTVRSQRCATACKHIRFASMLFSCNKCGQWFVLERFWWYAPDFQIHWQNRANSLFSLFSVANLIYKVMFESCQHSHEHIHVQVDRFKHTATIENSYHTMWQPKYTHTSACGHRLHGAIPD